MGALLLSCGKDEGNNVGGPAGLSCGGVQVGMRGTSQAVVHINDFIAEVERNNFNSETKAEIHQFQVGSAGDYASLLNTVSINESNFRVYRFRRLLSDGKIERNVSSSGPIYGTQTVNFSEDAEFGNNLCELKSKIVTVMKNASSVKKCPSDNYFYADGSCVEMKNVTNTTATFNFNTTTSTVSSRAAQVMIFTYNGKEYTIDLRRSLIKNPIYVRPAVPSSSTYTSPASSPVLYPDYLNGSF